MTVNGKTTSRSARIVCFVVISLAFLATFLAGVYLQDVTNYTTVSGKVSNIVIPLYSAVLGTDSKQIRNGFGNVSGGAITAAPNQSRRGGDTDDKWQVRRGVTPPHGSTVQSGHFILKSECEEKLKSISISSSSESENKNVSVAAVNDRTNEVRTSTNVIVFASMRTGSSFIGELLARRNDFFYLFEPGLRVQNLLKLKGLSEVVLTTKYLELLDAVYRCNFTNLRYFLSYSSAMTYDQQKKHIPGLMDPTTCHYYRKDKNNKTRRYCSAITRAAAEKKCLSNKGIGIKIIRINDINLLLPLVLDKEIKLKVIHLVRDPRGMVASRLMLYYHKRKGVFSSMYFGNPMRDIVEEYCKTWLKNVEIARYVKELRDNYLLIRYEDAAVDPFEAARKIYKFTGLQEGGIPRNVAEWLLNNTHKTNPKSSPYSTQRDSKETAEHWRSKLTIDMIKKIENTGKCRELMKAVGYRSIYDGRDLNKSNVSYVVKIPRYNSRKYDEYFPFS